MATHAYVDEIDAHVAASPEAVWRALGRYWSGVGRAAESYALLVRADPSRRDGAPLLEGSSVPGFRVDQAVAHERLRLAGRHLFSAYTLTFSLVESGGGTTLIAHTDAKFPGVHGRLYKAAVIDSGGHHVAVRRMLRAIGRMAERAE